MSHVSETSFDSVQVGDVIGARTVLVTRDRLVRYAGASGDFNPIHWSDVFAEQVGLPGVITHGMFTMGAAVALVEDWAGNPAAVIDFQTRFTRPVPVPVQGEASVEVTAAVGALDDAARTARIDLTVTFDGARVLGKSQAVVKLS